jgi:hypothetical protein
MENRKNHGRMKGIAWMSTGKLEMMTALLMCDGRYDDAVAIVPFSQVNAIGKAFEAHKKAALVQQFKDSYLEDRTRQFDPLFLGVSSQPTTATTRATSSQPTHRCYENATPDTNKLYTWPQIPKVNLVKNDWDGKTKDKNTWNPHWKSHCDGDPKCFFGDEVSNNKDTVRSCFAGTLTNDNMENFKTQWHHEAEPEKEEAKENHQFRN